MPDDYYDNYSDLIRDNTDYRSTDEMMMNFVSLMSLGVVGAGGLGNITLSQGSMISGAMTITIEGANAQMEAAILAAARTGSSVVLTAEEAALAARIEASFYTGGGGFFGSY